MFQNIFSYPTMNKRIILQIDFYSSSFISKPLATTNHCVYGFPIVSSSHEKPCTMCGLLCLASFTLCFQRSPML